MKKISANALPYLKTIPDEPDDTYAERNIAQLRKALREHPEDKLHLMQQLLIWMSVTEEYEEIIRLAEKLLAADTEKKYADDCYFTLARCYAEQKQTEKAIEYYRKTIETNPTIDEAITELMELYEEQFDYDNALKICELLDNEDILDGKENMYRYQGVIYYNKQEFDKALDCFKKALALYPEDKDGWITESIGETCWQKKEYDEAARWFKIALEKNPQSANAHYGMGLCYQDTDDYYRAMHHYTEALKIKPDFTNVYNNIAALTINHEGQLKKGIELLEKAIESTEDKNSIGNIYMNLARVYNKICEYDKANYYKAKFIKCCGFDVTFEEDEEDDL